MKAPHLISWFIPDKIFLEELAYQMMIHGVGGDMYRAKKDIWSPLLPYIDIHFFSKTKKAQEEVNTLISYHFGEEIFRRHDPKGVIIDYCNKIGIQWEYTTDV
jgi:hypothetical protein